MKFGKTLKAISAEDPQYGTMYLQYKPLAKFLKENSKERNVQALFTQMIETEHKRIVKIISIKLTELQLSCAGLMTNIQAVSLTNKTEDYVEEVLQTLTTHADEIGNKLAGLNKFIYYNMEGFRKIVKKHDKLTGVSLSWMESQKLRMFFVNAEHDLEDILLQLSDIYKFIKENRRSEQNEGEHLVSDETFLRKSKKYWVPNQDVFKFKVTVIKHLPLYFFGRKRNHKKCADVEELLLNPETKEKERVEKQGWISSVYMDNEDMNCYKTRVDKEEAATLTRVRWYGDPNKMTDGVTFPREPETGIYMERKTHHEKWSGLSSTKERFALNRDQVKPFLEGNLKPEEFAKNEKSTELANEILHDIKERKLHPVARTTYHRTAFQHDLTNDVRITLDCKMMISNENPKYQRDGAWKRAEEDLEKEGNWHIFSNSVLEVKLMGEAPLWLEELIEQPYITQVQKFSKYQHAAAMFYPDAVHQIPHWIDEEELKAAKEKEDSCAGSVHSADAVVLQIPDTAKNSYINPAFVHVDTDTTAVDMGGASTQTKTPNSKVFSGKDTNFVKNLLYGQSTVTNGKIENAAPPKETDTPKVKKSKKIKKAGKPGKPGKPVRVVKVEPKTHFANERTMLQWMRIGLTMFSMGGIIFTLGHSQVALYSGVTFMGISSLIVIYGLAIFYWRLHQITHRRSRVHDVFGPTIIAVLLVSAIVINLTIGYMFYNPQEAQQQPTYNLSFGK